MSKLPQQYRTGMQTKQQMQLKQQQKQNEQRSQNSSGDYNQAAAAQQQAARQKQNLQNYHFATTSPEILRKYSKYPATLTLHIFETHYRFNNSSESNIIPKNSPMIKSFLQCVLKEQIPVEMSELLKDFSLRLYDGCFILQVYDHRNMVPTGTVLRNGSTAEAKPAQPPSVPATGATPNSATGTTSSDSQTTAATQITSKPKTYRTLLRPTQLSLYYDLLYHTDSALSKFTDTLALQMESEILTLTNRELDLSAPLNPYQGNDYLRPDTEYPKKVWDEKTQDYKLIHQHSEAIERQPRKLHQDELVLHKSSEYEEFMLLLSNKYKRSDESQNNKLVVVGSSASATAAENATTSGSGSGTLSSSTTPIANGKGGKDDFKGKKNEKNNTAPTSNVIPVRSTSRTTGQFMRLRLIEEIRKKKEADKARQDAQIQEQAKTINQNNTRTIVTQNDKRPNPSASLPQQSQSQSQHNFEHQNQQQLNNNLMKAHQPGNQPVIKKQRMDIQQNGNAQIKNNLNNGGPQRRPGQDESAPNVGIGNSSSNSASFQGNNASAAPKPVSGTQSQSTLQQQQQQQIFHNCLTPEEQQHFRQSQTRMTAFAQMGQSGVTPTGQQLSAQEQAQALQQAKLIQQSLFQKYPVFFQRLREFQMIQQQRQQKQQQPQGQQKKPSQPGSIGNGGIADTSPQRSAVGSKSTPNAANQQVQQSPKSSQQDKKKRTYKKKG